MTTQRCGNCRFSDIWRMRGPVVLWAECKWQPTEPMPFWAVLPLDRVHEAEKDGAECAAWKERNDET